MSLEGLHYCTNRDHNPEQHDGHREDLDQDNLYNFDRANIMQSFVGGTDTEERGIKRTVPSTLEKLEGISLSSVVVDTVNMSSGKVNLHHPM